MSPESTSHQEAVSVSPLIAGVFTDLHSNAASRNLMLINNTFQHIHVPISETLINLMVRNLVHNAIRFSSNGRVEVVCELDSRWLYINVKDNGIGMEEHQVNGIMTAEEAANGHGLMAVHNSLQQLQGFMTINSIPCKGTLVKLHIPVAAA